MVCALGLEAQLVGVSHECDFPAAARTKPTVVRPALELASLAPNDIDDAVSSHLRSSESLYAVDEALLRSLDPDLILTQDLCQVCAPSGNDVTRVLGVARAAPDVMYFTPRDSWPTCGAICARLASCEGHCETSPTRSSPTAERRIDATSSRRDRARATRPRVFFAEWVDPIYCAGHWVPEMIALAGGVDPLARPRRDSVRVSWEEVVAAEPEVVIIAPCGFARRGCDAAGAAVHATRRMGFAAGGARRARCSSSTRTPTSRGRDRGSSTASSYSRICCIRSSCAWAGAPMRSVGL